MNTLHYHNSPLNMSECGSKGSPINIAQMVACVGQQSVGGKRAPNGFKVKHVSCTEPDSRFPSTLPQLSCRQDSSVGRDAWPCSTAWRQSSAGQAS